MRRLARRGGFGWPGWMHLVGYLVAGSVIRGDLSVPDVSRPPGCEETVLDSRLHHGAVVSQDDHACRAGSSHHGADLRRIAVLVDLKARPSHRVQPVYEPFGRPPH